MTNRTKEAVDHYIDKARELIERSALAFKNVEKTSPEDESLGYLTRKLAEEVGEVAEALIDQDYENALSEIGDVLWTATMLATRIMIEHKTMEDQRAFEMELQRRHE